MGATFKYRGLKKINKVIQLFGSLTFIILFILIISCNKESNNLHYNAANNFKNEDFKLKLSLIKTIDHIDSMFYPTYMTYNKKKKEFYILDYSDFYIKKYDKDFNKILKFGGRGNGPGEYLNPASILFCGDRIYLTEWDKKTVKVFYEDGTFEKNIETKGYVREMKNLGNNMITAYELFYGVENEQHFANNKLTVFSTEFETLKIILDKKTNKHNIFEYYNPFTTLNNNLYIARNSEEQYVIDIYNGTNYNLHNIIKKGYRKKKMSKEELEKLKKNTKEGFNSDYKGSQYKKAVTNLFADKNGYIYIYRYNDENIFNFDVFYNFELINNINIELPIKSISNMSKQIYFIDKNRVAINSYNKVYVYSYKIHL